MVATTIPDLTVEQWTKHGIKLFPQPWVGDEAKQKGGVYHSAMSASASNIRDINTDLIYAFLSSRIATATDTELDLVSQDFFGTTLPRQPGEPDASFRVRIQATLFVGQVTEEAISTIIERLTGVKPRMMESWELLDTCAFDSMSYWDVDTVENPFRWASPELRYQGFIETALPPFSSNGQNPVWMLDKGFSWDIPGCCYIEPDPSWFIGSRQMDAVITDAKAFGTTIWRKYTHITPSTFLIGGTRFVTGGTFTIDLALRALIGPYIVIIQPSWYTAVGVPRIDPSGFTANFAVPAPNDACFFDYVAVPLTVPGTGVVPVTVGSSISHVPNPAIPFGKPMVTANWITNQYHSGTIPGGETISWATAAPNSVAPLPAFGYCYFDPSLSDTVPVLTGAPSAIINLPVAIFSTYAAFLLPSWNTTCSIVKTPTTITATFSVPPPVDSTLDWAVFKI